MISNKRGKVARFCLFKPAYKLGEDIVGSLDFTVATVECMQLSVALLCQEEALGLQETKLHTFSRHHEVCYGFQHTQLVLPIPLHVTPAFTTKLGEFITENNLFFIPFNNNIICNQNK